MENHNESVAAIELAGEKGLRGNPNRLARALKAYVACFDKIVEAEDLTVGLPIKVDAFTAEYIPRALNRLGLVGSLSKVKSLKKASFPICAFLEGSRFVVIYMGRHDEYIYAEPDAFEGLRKVDCQEIDSVFSGQVIQAAHSFKAIEEKHLVARPRGHWFWSHFKDKKSLILHIVVGTFVANLLAVGISLFTLQVYDRVLPNESYATLWVLVAGVVLAIVFEGCLRVARSMMVDVAGREMEISASTWLFQRLQGMKLSKSPMSPGSRLYAIKEFSSVREFFTTSSIGSAADIPFVFIFLALIYFIAGPVAYLVMGAMVLIVVPSLLARGKMLRLSEEMLGGTSAANKILIEATYGQENIKAMRAESHFQNEWEELLRLNSAKMTEQRVLSARLQYWSTSVQQVAFISAITTGCYLVFAGELTMGAIIAISILTSRALSPVTNLAGLLSRWQMVKSGLSMMDEIAKSEQYVEPGKSMTTADSLLGDFRLENVVFAFDPEARPILQIEKLNIEAGQNLVVLGSNGSGKSTLLRLLAGLIDSTQGSITLDGMLINQIAPWDLRRHVGYLSQEIRLFTGTLRRNLEMTVGAKSDADIFEALAFAGIDDFVKSHPKGLSMEIADGGTGMSIGQKQSIGLARLYLQDPSILLLDEPTASFDQALEVKVVNNLTDWLAGKTCVISTHRPAILKLADEVMILKNGRLAVKDKTEIVMARVNGKTNKRVTKRSGEVEFDRRTVQIQRNQNVTGREGLDALNAKIVKDMGAKPVSEKGEKKQDSRADATHEKIIKKVRKNG